MKRQYAFSTAGLFSSEFNVFLFCFFHGCSEQQQEILKHMYRYMFTDHVFKWNITALHETALSGCRGLTLTFVLIYAQAQAGCSTHIIRSWGGWLKIPCISCRSGWRGEVKLRFVKKWEEDLLFKCRSSKMKRWFLCTETQNSNQLTTKHASTELLACVDTGCLQVKNG